MNVIDNLFGISYLNEKSCMCIFFAYLFCIQKTVSLQEMKKLFPKKDFTKIEPEQDSFEMQEFTEPVTPTSKFNLTGLRSSKSNNEDTRSVDQFSSKFSSLLCGKKMHRNSPR